VFSRKSVSDSDSSDEGQWLEVTKQGRKGKAPRYAAPSKLCALSMFKSPEWMTERLREYMLLI